MTDREAQAMLLTVVVEWLDGNTATDVFVDRYWSVRRYLLETNPAAFDGAIAQILSHMDVALHSYWPEPQGKGEVGESQLRLELQALLGDVRALDPSLPPRGSRAEPD